MSMKEIRELAYHAYFDLTPEDMKKLADAVDELPWEDPSGIQHSFSAEGGVAIPYVKLGLPRDFGEWLHLRYFERTRGFGQKGKTYHMSFIFNINRGLGSVSRNRKAKEAIVTGMKRLLDFVEKATGKPRDPHEPWGG